MISEATSRRHLNSLGCAATRNWNSTNKKRSLHGRTNGVRVVWGLIALISRATVLVRYSFLACPLSYVLACPHVLCPCPMFVPMSYVIRFWPVPKLPTKLPSYSYSFLACPHVPFFLDAQLRGTGIQRIKSAACTVEQAAFVLFGE